MAQPKFKPSKLEEFTDFVRRLPVSTPQEVFDQLASLGYRGQDAARRALSLMAYRHVRRVKRIYVDGVSRSEVMPKTNYLCVGPTGCGKTFLVELLFRDILKLPTVIVDVTGFTETGYVGQDTIQILTRLLQAANGNPLVASIGIVCLDEFDKLASGRNNAVFAGAGTTKDVNGMGVQRELLKMLESNEVEVPTGAGHCGDQPCMAMSTADVAFVACGAFSGLKQAARQREDQPTLGFGRQPSLAGDDRLIACSYRQEEMDDVSGFMSYGFMPELIGRFTRVVPYQALDHETLRAILNESLVQRMVSEFADEGCELLIDDQVLDRIVKECLARETGARGLTSSLTRHVEEVAFDTFGRGKGGRVRLRQGTGGIQVIRDF
ncbi:MAG: AAA family ATPase [Polyangia bacterium]|jgi:ATP-dependent Clp protease ATP-binding subunit ClpX|nr:AAA family ATPase [Polyangia bacterium]